MFCHRLSGVEGAGPGALSKADVTYVADPFDEGFKEQLAPVLQGSWTGAQSAVPDVSEVKAMLTDSSPTVRAAAPSPTSDTSSVTVPGRASSACVLGRRVLCVRTLHTH